jgi:hypothetical protein
MKRISLLGFLFLGLASLPALADDCALLGGNLPAANASSTERLPVPPNNRTARSTSARRPHQGDGEDHGAVRRHRQQPDPQHRRLFVMEDGAVINGDTFPTSGGRPRPRERRSRSPRPATWLAGDRQGRREDHRRDERGLLRRGGRGGNITLVSTGGDITTLEKSEISSSSVHCPAGRHRSPGHPRG